MSVTAFAATTSRRSGLVRLLPTLVVGALAAFAGGWYAATFTFTSDTANAVVREVNLENDRVIGVCLKDSPLGLGDGAGTCGAAFLADGVVSNPQLLVDMTVKVTVLSHEERHNTPVFLIEAAE